MSEVSRILQALENGDPCAADDLLPIVYEELRQMAHAKLAVERAVDSLQATALVHEAYLRLVDGDAGKSFKNRRYFFGAAAEAMRRILMDRARKRNRKKHGREHSRVDLFDVADLPEDEEMLALNDALTGLEREDPVAAEVVKLKFFAGQSRQAIADLMVISIHEVRSKWAYARAWLQVAIEK